MSCATWIGRIGGLAIALGIGAAVPGTAHADTADTGSPTDSSSTTAAASPSALTDTGVKDTARQPLSAHFRDLVSMVVRISGGARTTAADDDSAATPSVGPRTRPRPGPRPSSTDTTRPRIDATPVNPQATRAVSDDVKAVIPAAVAPQTSAGDDVPAPPPTTLLSVLGFVRRAGDQQPSQLARPAAVAQNTLALPGADSDILADLIDALAAVQQAVVPVILNRTPVATPQQLSTPAGQATVPTAFDAVDPDGDRMTFTVNPRGLPGAPKHGTVAVDDGGSFVYTPDDGFTGTDTFSVAVNDDTDLHLHGPLNWLNAFASHQDMATVTVFVGQSDTSTISGTLDVLDYNIADLPWPLSSAANPRDANTREISTLLNAYDVVNVQEDFSYHWDLIANSLFPFQTTPRVPTLLWPLGVPFADGLNTLSSYEVDRVDRVNWDKCTRDNCLTPKGFTYGQLQLPGGETVDVYNVHMDTDRGVSNENLVQLSTYIKQNSAGRPVIVTGDFNQLYSESGNTLDSFAAANGLTDVYKELPPCGPGQCESFGKFFYRSGSGVELQAVQYVDESAKFVNANGQGLSDGVPIKVQFIYIADNVSVE